MSADKIEEAICQAAVEPAHVAVDGQSVQARPIGDLIQAADREASRNASKNPAFGLDFRRFEPGGCG